MLLTLAAQMSNVNLLEAAITDQTDFVFIRIQQTAMVYHAIIYIHSKVT
jgi:hypothetical protein